MPSRLPLLREDVAARDRSRFESERVQELRFARRCYAHLAGALAVDIHRALLYHGFLRAHPDRMYSLTDRGRTWLDDIGANRSPSRACIDWTERRHHLGGALGAAVVSWLTGRQSIAPIRGERAVRVTQLGVREFERQLGITVPSRPHR